MPTIDELYGSDFAFTDDFVATPTGDLETLSGLENLRQALYRRLITSKGSIVHRPNYGVGIKSFLNVLSNVDNQRRLAMEINEQFVQDERVERVLGVQIKSESLTPDRVEILVRVRAVGYGDQQFSFIPEGDS